MLFRVKIDAVIEATDIDDAMRTIGDYYIALAHKGLEVESPYVQGYASIERESEQT